MTTAFQLLNCLPALFDVFYLYVMHKNATITNSFLYREVFTDIQSRIMLLQRRLALRPLLEFPRLRRSAGLVKYPGLHPHTTSAAQNEAASFRIAAVGAMGCRTLRADPFKFTNINANVK